MSDFLDARRAGVLLHLGSMPCNGDSGPLGADAYRFVDFLAAAGFSVWQTLPLGPVDSFGSPYSLSSAYAGNTKLVCVEALRQNNLGRLPAALPFETFSTAPVDLYRSFRETATIRQSALFTRFMHRHRRWVFAYAMFELCRQHHDGAPWWEWPNPLRDREWDALVAATTADKDTFRSIVFQQYLFELQWTDLKSYANIRGISIFGDLPFYMDRNSVDVWWSRRFFSLDDAGEPAEVAGVPPDYFNSNGQLWGNPLYDWDALKEDQYMWWRARLLAQLLRFDLLRIDHFRALESYWAVPATAKTARDGQWRSGHGRELLTALVADGPLPLVAEDLGIITDEVRKLRDEFNLPGMAVQQFGFDGSPDNPHLAKNVSERTVIYTGTHDNDTLIGWYESLEDSARAYVHEVLDCGERYVPDVIMENALASAARLAVIPLQDILKLDSSARMNTPGETVGNWSWKFDWSQFESGLTGRLYHQIRSAGRLN